MREMKASQIDWVEHIPVTWQDTKMGSVVRVKKDIAGRSGMPVLAVTQRGIIEKDISTNEGQLANDYSDYQCLRPGEFAINSMDLITGGFGISSHDGVTSPDYRVFVNQSEQVMCSRYLLRVIEIAYKNRVFYAMGQGVTNLGRWRLPRERFLQFRIPLPPLEEQQTIAEYLDVKCSTADALKTNLEAQIEKLAEYRQALITQAVTKGLDPNAPMKDSGIEWIGGTPAHWKRVRMAALYEPTSENADESLPILTVSIADGVSDREIGNEERTRQVIYGEDRSKYRRVQPGDLVYNTMRAWQGALGAVSVHGAVSPAYVTVRPQGEVNSQFVQFLLRTDAGIQEMHRLSYGVADFRLRLYWESFRTIHISLPPLEDQNRIVEHCNRINDSVKALVDTPRQQIEKLVL